MYPEKLQQIKTMSSLEIAELTGKRHDNVMRDIKNMISELEKAMQSDSSNLSCYCKSGTYTNKRGKEYEMLLLDKETTLTLLSGYDIVARHKIIQRWTHLETERAEEQQNPELGIKRAHERATLAWKKKNKDDKWIEARIQGIATRNSFTKTLAEHGVHTSRGFSNCTNAVYTGLYGGSSEVVRHKKGLTRSQNIRDHLSQVELSAIQLSESLASEHIQTHNLHGNGPCELACRHTAKQVGRAIVEARKESK